MQEGLFVPTQSAASNVGLKLVFAAAFIIALVMAWLPVDWIVGRFLYDDMFYYLRVAEHIAAGSGSTFDGVEPTNGFHPLWMLVCTLLALLFDGDNLVHAVLTVAAVLHVGQGIVLARILSAYARPAILIGLTALYLLNWRTLSINLCGLEGVLATFLALLIMEHLLLRPPGADRRRAFRLGLLIGAGVLARFDLMLLAAFACAWVVLDGSQVRLKERIQAVALMLLGVVLMLLPWFVFSWQVSGVLLPNSRLAVKLLTGVSYDFANPGQAIGMAWSQLWSFIWWSSDIANLLGLFPIVAPAGRGMLVAAALVGGVIAVVAAGLLWHRHERAARAGMIVLAYCLIHASYYAVFHRVELRYVMTPLVLFLVPVGILAEILLGRHPTVLAKRMGAAVMAWALLVSAYTGVIAADKGYGSVRAHKYHYVARDVAAWLQKEHPKTVVGSWNAGIISYFSRTELVNLDGVINDGALKAIQGQGIADYILKRGITLIVEEPRQLDGNLRKFSRPGSCCAFLGPVIFTARDQDGRSIVVRPVTRGLSEK